MKECTKYAEDAGIILALQNHAPVIKDYRDVLTMVNEINSPSLKVSLDAPIMVDKSAENIQTAAQAVGDLQVLTHFGGEYERDDGGKVNGATFYTDFARAMHDIEYNGYFSYELCHSLPVVNGERVGIEYAEKNAELAAEFMREIITQVVS
jgi:sugar phosphate isomerase/epimerase